MTENNWPTKDGLAKGSAADHNHNTQYSANTIELDSGDLVTTDLLINTTDSAETWTLPEEWKRPMAALQNELMVLWDRIETMQVELSEANTEIQILKARLEE